jgi:4-hydroxybenzoate polyprenyltransferase
MHPKQKLRLMSLVGLVTGLPALFYVLTTEHPLNRFHAWVVIAYMFVVLAVEVVYMLRHREELRDPPEQQERQRQWAMKNGPAVLNVFLVLGVVAAVWLAFQLYDGHLDPRRTILSRVSLIAFLPALVLLFWIKIRLRIKRRPPDHKDSR